MEAALKTDPGNPELESLVKELQEVIALTQAVLAEQNGASSVSTSSATNHGAGHHNSHNHNHNHNHHHHHGQHHGAQHDDNTGDADHSERTYAVGDNVLARWTSGDNQLYPARITSITGSRENPVFLVKFTQYNVTEQLYPKDLRPASKKRKAAAAAAAAAAASSSSAAAGSGSASATAGDGGSPNTAVISQPASINAELAEARRSGSEKPDSGGGSGGGAAATGGAGGGGGGGGSGGGGAGGGASASSGGSGSGSGSAGPKKKTRKLEQKKVLEAGQKKWQDFAAKGVKGKVGKTKRIGEASMFRTPESVHGRGLSLQSTLLSCC